MDTRVLQGFVSRVLWRWGNEHDRDWTVGKAESAYAVFLASSKQKSI